MVIDRKLFMQKHVSSCASNSPTNVKNTFYDKNPIIHNSLKVWNQLLRTVKAPKTYLDAPIRNNQAFLPGLEDNIFNVWRERGITTIKDFYINGCLLYFQQLQVK